MARAGAGSGLLPLPAEVPAGSRKPMTVTMGQQSGIRPVITSKDGRGSYVLLRVLVSDKNHTTILLGAPAFADPRRPDALLVHPTERVIVKAVQLSWLSDDRAERPLEELAVLWHLREDPSPHIVQLVDHMQDGSHLYIILRYHGGGDLFERVSLCSRGLPPAEACRYFMHMAEGLRHLKRHGIAHGDLSLENAVLWGPGDARGRNSGGSSVGSGGSAGEETNGDGVVSGGGGGDVVVVSGGDVEGSALDGVGCTLIDLGMCRVLPDGETMCTDMRPRGKPSYISPEVLSGNHVPVDPFAADVWSLGICLYAMLTGRPLYADPEDPAFILLAKGRADELLRHYHGFGLVLDELAHDLICAMLRPRAEDRPTVEEVMSHPWVRAHLDRAVEGGSGGVGVGAEEGGVESGGGSSSVTTNPASDDDEEEDDEGEGTTMEDDDDDDDADEMDTVMCEDVRTPAVVHVGRPPLPPDGSGGAGRRSGGGGDGGGGGSAVAPTGRTLSIFSAGLFVGRGESRALSETGSSVCTDDGGSESEAACQLATELATPTHHHDGVDMHLDARDTSPSSASLRHTGETSPLPTAKPPSAVEHAAGVDLTLSAATSLPPPSSPSSVYGADTRAHTPSSPSASPTPPSSPSRSSSSVRGTCSISNSGGDCGTSMFASTPLVDAAHAHIPHL